jgi:hypothetical protein
MDAKLILQNYNSAANLLSFNVSSADNDRGIAALQNDIATSAYNTASSNLNKTLQDLQAANATVFMLQQSLSDAKKAVGQAQFTLTQAMNSLYVAQAAKEQSDKQLLIASAQIVQLPVSLTPSLFAGCDIGNYPSMFGTATITDAS